MKRLILVFLIFILNATAWTEKFAENIGKGSMVIYSPSLTYFQDNSSALMQRFYGPNYTQMLEEIKLVSQQKYGVNLYSNKELMDIGIDPAGPLAYIHVQKDNGYLMISVKDEYKFSTFLKNKYPKGLFFEIKQGIAYLSADSKNLQSRTNMLLSGADFKYAIKMSAFKWDKFMVWIDSTYLGEVSVAQGVTSYLGLPSGATLLSFDIKINALDVHAYSVSLRSESLKFMRSMIGPVSNGKFDILDYGWGNPAIMLHARLDVMNLYRYITDIDQLNILGITSVLNHLKDDYQVDIIRDMIANTDGRVKLVVNQFDPKNKKYDFYGSLGIKNKAQAQLFMDSLRDAILKSGAKLYSFEIFTNPVYHYEYKGVDLFFGAIEQDFFISSQKETLVQVVKNIFEDKKGYLENLPSIFSQASLNNKSGIYLLLDVQGLLGNIQPSQLKFNQDLMTGIKDIQVEIQPEKGELPYGWSAEVHIQFYQ